MLRIRFPPVVLVLFFTALCFQPVLSGEFVWDELAEARLNLPKAVFDLSVFQLEHTQVNWIYRPVPALTGRAVDGLATLLVPEGTPLSDPRRAWLPHLFSLVLHLVASWLLMLFAARCLRGRAGAAAGTMAAGLLFAVHPIHVENVAWSSATADTWATIFVLGALLAFSRGREHDSMISYSFSAGLFFLAMLSKEVALPCLLVFPLWGYFFPEEGVSSQLRERSVILPVLLIFAVGWLVWTKSRLGFTLADVVPPDIGLACKQVLASIGFFTRKIWFPWPLTPLIPRLPGLAETTTWLAIGLALSGAAAWAARRGDRLYLFCLLWFYLTCLPSSYVALKDLQHGVLAERYLYLPSVGFAVAAGSLAARFRDGRAKNVVYVLLGAIVLIFGVTSWRGTLPWLTEIDLMTTITRQEQSKNQILGWENLGVEYYSSGRLDEAERCFRKALSPGMAGEAYQVADAHASLALVLFHECAVNRNLVERQGFSTNPVSWQEAESEFNSALASGSADERHLRILSAAQRFRLHVTQSGRIPDTKQEEPLVAGPDCSGNVQVQGARVPGGGRTSASGSDEQPEVPRESERRW